MLNISWIIFGTNLILNVVLKRSLVMSWFCFGHFGQVLSFTTSLAGLVRQNFQGITLSAQGQSNEPTVPALSTGNNPNRQVYNFSVVLLDPRDDSIPRGHVRQDLLNTDRIVQISLGRGTQEAGALRALNSAFPFLRGTTTK